LQKVLEMSTVQVFDTLAYSKALVARGFDKKHADALAEVNQEFFVGDLATKEFVHAEAKSIRSELRSEIREAVLGLKIWTGGVAIAMIGALATLIKLLG